MAIKFRLPKGKPSVRQIFTGIVMFMWVTSYLMSLANSEYEPPDYVNPLILLVGGYLFATSSSKEK